MFHLGQNQTTPKQWKKCKWAWFVFHISSIYRKMMSTEKCLERFQTILAFDWGQVHCITQFSYQFIPHEPFSTFSSKKLLCLWHFQTKTSVDGNWILWQIINYIYTQPVLVYHVYTERGHLFTLSILQLLSWKNFKFYFLYYSVKANKILYKFLSMKSLSDC